MCQMKVVFDSGDKQETVMEHVTMLQKNRDGIEVSTLFEEPKTVAGVQVGRIDFLAGTVTLVPESSNSR